jgi:AraC-like DNA-binding protein
MKSSNRSVVASFHHFVDLYRAVGCPRIPKLTIVDTLRLEHFNDGNRNTHPFRGDFFSLMLILKPNISFKINDAFQRMSAGSMAFHVPNQIRSFMKDGDLSGYVLYFKSELFGLGVKSKFFRQFPFLDWTTAQFMTLNAVDLLTIQPLFEKLLRESESESPSLDLLKGYASVLLFELKRIYERNKQAMQLPNSRAGEIALQFENLVRVHYADKRAVQDYAAMLNVSPKYLSKCVKAALGKAALEVIHDALIVEAKSLLFQTEKSISEIAAALQFESAAQFSTFFKEKTTVSPTDFREERRFLHNLAAF